MLRANALALLLGLALVAAPTSSAQAPAAPMRPQAPTASQGKEPVGHTASVGGRSAKVVIDLSDGSRVTVSLSGGTVYLNDQPVSTYAAGGPFERAWRGVLSKSGELSTPQLVFALRSLPPGALGPDAQEAMAAVAAALPPVGRGALGAHPPDLSHLMEGPAINLDSMNQMARDISREVTQQVARQALRGSPASSFSVARLTTDIAGLFGTLVALASLGFGALFFVPRRLEVVADTVRRSPMRAFLAGLFAQPLLLPALVTLIIGLVLTVVGILVVPFAILAFVLAVAAALVGGYLAVARVVGEIYVRRRGQEGLYTSGWSTYRYLVYGLIGLLLIWAPAILLRWIPGAGMILMITAAAFTWAMATAGFGAALLSRAGGGASSRAGPAPQLSTESLWTAPVRSTEVRRSNS